MAIKPVKASNRKAYLKAASYGSTGSGKTFTFLLLAEHLAKLDEQKRRVFYLDTEGGTDFYAQDVPSRKVHPQAFDFDTTEEPTRELLAVRDFLLDPETAKNYAVVVLDSMTHLWESAFELWTGKRTSIGTLPVQAWQVIKKPYKAMMSAGINGKFHFLICGRLRTNFEEDNDTGKLTATGTSMKAETETPYEPDVCLHMYQERAGLDAEKPSQAVSKGMTDFVIKAFVEKDRTGVLQGRTLVFPKATDFDPLLQYISTAQQHVTIQTTANAAAKDASALAQEAEEREAFRAKTYEDIKTAIRSANDIVELRAAWDLTKGNKAILGDDLYEQLQGEKDTRKTTLTKPVGV